MRVNFWRFLSPCGTQHETSFVAPFALESNWVPDTLTNSFTSMKNVSILERQHEWKIRVTLPLGSNAFRHSNSTDSARLCHDYIRFRSTITHYEMIKNKLGDLGWGNVEIESQSKRQRQIRWLTYSSFRTLYHRKPLSPGSRKLFQEAGHASCKLGA